MQALRSCIVCLARTMCVPAKATLDMVTLHGPVAGNNVLDGRCQQVAIMRCTGSEGRAVVKGVGLLVGRQLELSLESVYSLQKGVSRGRTS
jgi:hypothetical protein